MLLTPTRFSLVLALTLIAGEQVMAQEGANVDHRVKPTGPAAVKADELIRGYTARLEKEIEQGRKELQGLRNELHELIDLRYSLTEAIAELRGEMATKGTYSADPPTNPPAAPEAVPAQPQGIPFHRDFVYGLGSAMPKEPSVEQREQLRRLTPRTDLKRMIEKLRAEVDETRAEVDLLAYKLLELSSGFPTRLPGMGGMGGQEGYWFGSMGTMQGGMMRMNGGGMR